MLFSDTLKLIALALVGNLASFVPSVAAGPVQDLSQPCKPFCDTRARTPACDTLKSSQWWMAYVSKDGGSSPYHALPGYKTIGKADEFSASVLPNSQVMISAMNPSPMVSQDSKGYVIKFTVNMPHSSDPKKNLLEDVFISVDKFKRLGCQMPKPFYDQLQSISFAPIHPHGNARKY